MHSVCFCLLQTMMRRLKLAPTNGAMVSNLVLLAQGTFNLMGKEVLQAAKHEIVCMRQINHVQIYLFV